MGVRMVGIVVDDAAPLNLSIEVVLNAADHGLGGPGKVGLLVLGRDNDLEEALVAGLLPFSGNCTVFVRANTSVLRVVVVMDCCHERRGWSSSGST